MAADHIRDAFEKARGDAFEAADAEGAWTWRPSAFEAFRLGYEAALRAEAGAVGSKPAAWQVVDDEVCTLRLFSLRTDAETFAKTLPQPVINALFKAAWESDDAALAQARRNDRE